ncbi:olfactory receptor 2B6-like [Bombina bombina]|uniref:olfactory receptor 2B6-like n=1 Tax=Bombina bombina TaxID=8345 RepID=UPI00235A7CBC|nr:olfactory receptor 2B6-like [Bombina bombina]
MAWKNETLVTEFILLGLSSNARTQIVLFVVFLLIYLVILIGNFLIIIVSISDKNLQTPMYFFLTNLSFLDICYSSSIVPRMLRDLLSLKKIISFQECAAQMYISLSLGETECILLAIMAYDRYAAICYPLHYTTIINRSVCIKIASGTWICGFLLSISHVALTLNVKMCGENKIKHFLCEVPGVLALGCGDVSVIESVIFLVGVVILMIPVTFIIISYIIIVSAILKISSTDGKQKALSTCGSHMMVVTLFYGTAMAIYMKPRTSSSPDADMMIAVFYTIITPMLNPLIYTLRNKEVKTALKRVRIKEIVF